MRLTGCCLPGHLCLQCYLHHCLLHKRTFIMQSTCQYKTLKKDELQTRKDLLKTHPCWIHATCYTVLIRVTAPRDQFTTTAIADQTNMKLCDCDCLAEKKVHILFEQTVMKRLVHVCLGCPDMMISRQGRE